MYLYNPSCCCGCVEDSTHACVCGCRLPKIFHTSDTLGAITLGYTGTGTNNWSFTRFNVPVEAIACQSGEAACVLVDDNAQLYDLKYDLTAMCSPFFAPPLRWRFMITFLVQPCGPPGGTVPDGLYYGGKGFFTVPSGPFEGRHPVNCGGFNATPNATTPFVCGSHDLIEITLPTDTNLGFGTITIPVPGGGGYFAITP